MSRKNLPGYLLHKRSGQVVVVIQGKTIYLGKYKSKASREEYERVIGEYIANGRKLPPTRGNGFGISIEELIIKFLDYAASYYQKNGRQTATISHCKLALSPVVKQRNLCQTLPPTPGNRWKMSSESTRHWPKSMA